MNELSPQSLIKDSFKLFSLPDIYFQISEMINDPRFTAADMGKVISMDPGLSVRLLKVVNSSFYGFQARIDTISRAITIVGTEDLNALVLATTVIDKFSNIPSELVNMTDYWLRCVHVGIIAKLLAKKTAVLHSERLFMAGLLHDIGSLILYSKLPDKSREVLLTANYSRQLVGNLEQEIIGFTHADVGAALIKSWDLPETLYEAVGCYLTPDSAQTHKSDAYLLYLASRLSDIPQQYDSVDEVLLELSDEGLSIIRISAEQIFAIKKRADEELADIFELIAPGKSIH